MKTRSIFFLRPLDLAITLRRACWRALEAGDAAECRRWQPLAEKACDRLEGQDVVMYVAFVQAYVNAPVAVVEALR
jgi:hypothetical protein